jgi:hypothetical protein
VNPQLKRSIKRVLIKTVQPPLRVCANVVQRVLAMRDEAETGGERQDFHTTGDYLNYWQRRIVAEIQTEFGHVVVPGSQTERPHYAWGVLNGAYLASALGIRRISVIEFGVAGGNGLVMMEVIADKIQRALGVDIDVYGFDGGQGYPKPIDYRDTPNLFQPSDYPMDVEKLSRRLRHAKLVLGPVESTIPTFIQSSPAPLAFTSFDMSLYSSTAKALKVFEATEAMLLPRIQCYFGALMGLTYSDFTADRLAISEFNAARSLRKISPCYGLDIAAPDARLWAGRMYLAHIFDHTLYGVDDGLVKIRDNPLVV